MAKKRTKQRDIVYKGQKITKEKSKTNKKKKNKIKTDQKKPTSTFHKAELSLI
jgi:hypothetical protein